MSGSIEDRLAELERRMDELEPQHVDDLADILKSFPGGLPELAKACGYHRESLYQFIKAERSKAFPFKRAMLIARAFGDRRALGQRVTINRLRSCWLRRFRKNKEGEA
jgi:DNA-binding phage protein